MIHRCIGSLDPGGGRRTGRKFQNAQNVIEKGKNTSKMVRLQWNLMKLGKKSVQIYGSWSIWGVPRPPGAAGRNFGNFGFLGPAHISPAHISTPHIHLSTPRRPARAAWCRGLLRTRRTVGACVEGVENLQISIEVSFRPICPPQLWRSKNILRGAIWGGFPTWGGPGGLARGFGPP